MATELMDLLPLITVIILSLRAKGFLQEYRITITDHTRRGLLRWGDHRPAHAAAPRRRSGHFRGAAEASCSAARPRDKLKNDEFVDEFVS